MNIYKGEFTGIGGSNYTISIIPNYDKDENYTLRDAVPITLGGEPFNVEMDTEGDNLYRTMKCSAATINIISDDYLFDIYTAKAQGTKVIFENTDTGEILWTGYVEPMLYDMGFVEEREEIEISALDSLSTLQYIKYTPVVAKPSVRALNELIGHILRQCDAYTEFYFPKSIKIVENDEIQDNISFCQSLQLNERNFYNSVGTNLAYDQITDEDLKDSAITYKEVLECIMTYFGLTAIPYGDKVFFAEYDSLKNGFNAYEVYDVATSEFTGETTIGDNYHITGSSYADTGASISLDEVYNKITVTTSSNKIEEIIPAIDQNLTNITASVDSGFNGETDPKKGILGSIKDNSKLTDIYYTGSNINHNTEMFFMKSYSGKGHSFPHHYFVAVRYLKNQNYKFYQYDSTTMKSLPVSELNYTNTKSMLGAIQCKMMYKYLENGDGQNILNDWYKTPAKYPNAFDDILNCNRITNISFDDYIILRTPRQYFNEIHKISESDLPFFETTFDDNITFGGKNNYLIISGKWLFHAMDVINPNNESEYNGYRQVVPIDKVENVDGDKKTPHTEMYVLSKLQWGNSYWNGESWQDNECAFKLYINTKGTYKMESDNVAKFYTAYKDLPYKEHDFGNQEYGKWNNNVSEDGYIIPIPKLMIGEIKFTMYRPHYPTYNGWTNSQQGDSSKKLHDQHPYTVFIKDFKIEPYIADTTYSDIIETETEYSATIDENVVQEFSDIELSVFTNDGKTPSYSIAMYKDDNGNYQYLDEVVYESLHALLANNDLSDHQRLENHLVLKLANQYSEPAIKLEATLKGTDLNRPYLTFTDKTLSGKTFITDSVNIDYKNNCSTLQLIEKR